MEYNKFTIKPIHNALTAVASTSTYSSLTSPYETSPKAFVDLAAVSNTSSYALNKTSGYQYLMGAVTHTFEEVAAPLDQVYTDRVQGFEDVFNVTDILNNGYTFETDLLPILDEWHLDATQSFTEPVSSQDELAAGLSLDEFVPVADQLTSIQVKSFTELVGSTDNAYSFRYVDYYDTVVLQIEQRFQEDDTTVISVSAPYDNYDTTNIGVIPYSIPDTANASSISNPFTPTIIVGGAVYTYNASTAPSSYNSQTNFIGIDNAAIGGIDLCDIYDYSINLDYSGGTWSIFANAPVGGLGTAVTIFGLNGTITRVGKEYSSSQFGYRTEGIFGVEALSRPLNMLAFANPSLFNLLTNPRTGVKSAQVFGTYAGAAAAIASIANIDLRWYVYDFPYIETFSQEGASAMDALYSLASTVGGTLRWDGGRKYSVVFPTQTVGSFSIPDGRIITNANTQTNYDITTGTAGVGPFGFNVLTNNVGLTTNLPDTPSVDRGLIQPILICTKPLTAQDAPIIQNVPPDAVEAYIQILYPVESTDNQGNPQYVTRNENEWFSLGGPGLGNRYFYSDTGGYGNLAGQYQLKLRCDSTLLPNAATINNGRFTLRMGVRRYNPLQEFLTLKDSRDAQIRNQIARTVGQMRFVKNYTTNLSSQFFGGVPMPGMRLLNYSICGDTIDGGVIQSVNISSPGVLTINAAQFAEINFHANMATQNINEFNA